MIRIVYTCDEWKSKSSRRMVGLFQDDDEKYIKFLKDLVKEDIIELEPGYELDDITIDANLDIIILKYVDILSFKTGVSEYSITSTID